MIVTNVPGLSGRHANAQTIDRQSEYNVKAAFLYGFARYVSWPDESFPNAASPFIIGVLGNDPFGSALDRIASTKTVQGRKILVQRFRFPEGIERCHILFITKSFDPAMEATVVRSVGGKHVLLVGESPGFARRGGIINFIIQEGNIRFELNVDKARIEELELDAKLLSLGIRVKSDHLKTSFPLPNAFPIHRSQRAQARSPQSH